MIKVGITGGDGFLGYHTYHTLKFDKGFKVIKLNKEFLLFGTQ